jgi:predicted O-methyltransferase YrrM
MPRRLQNLAAKTPGFMLEAEGLALHRLACQQAGNGPLLEIGTYCGKSAVYLGDGARQHRNLLFTVDHHRGSEEHQPGEEYHNPDLVNPRSGRFDTLATARVTIEKARLEDYVVLIVGQSAKVAASWQTPLSLVFIDGGHSEEAAQADYQAWAPHVMPGGVLAIHDVFPDPADGGQAPYHIYRQASDSGTFEEIRAEGSLRALRRLSSRLV